MSDTPDPELQALFDELDKPIPQIKLKKPVKGLMCPACKSNAVIREGGKLVCTNCGHEGD